MKQGSGERRVLIDRLRLNLPLSVRPRQRLIERLSAFLPLEAMRSSLLVTSVYDAGDELGVLCQLDLTPHRANVSHLVVPLDQIALDRRFRLDQKSGQHHRLLDARRVSQTRAQ